jgi:hypothetical protein
MISMSMINYTHQSVIASSSPSAEIDRWKMSHPNYADQQLELLRVLDEFVEYSSKTPSFCVYVIILYCCA